jgi:hypothetical protein
MAGGYRPLRNDGWKHATVTFIRDVCVVCRVVCRGHAFPMNHRNVRIAERARAANLPATNLLFDSPDLTLFAKDAAARAKTHVNVSARSSTHSNGAAVT